MDGSSALPRHVVLVLVDLAGGGTQKVVAGLARALLDAGPDVTIVTNRSSDGRWSAVSDRARIIELAGHLETKAASGMPPVIANLRWLMRSARRIRSTVCATGPNAPVLAFLPGTNVLSALACLGLDVPLVLSERNDITRQRISAPMRLARRVLYRTATVVTTNRPTDESILTKLAGRVPVRTVRNPPPRIDSIAHPAASRTVLCVGRLARHKRHRDVIAAFARIAEEFSEWSLRIVGDGPERAALEQQVAELELYGRVEIVGWSRDVGGELARAALFVQASEHEGVSNAILEAMAAGLPVVASETSVSAHPDHPEAQRTSSVFPTGDVDALSSAIGRLMGDPALRVQLGGAGTRQLQRITAEPLSAWEPVLSLAAQRSSPGT